MSEQDRPLTESAQDLLAEFRRLIRLELELAQTEIRQQVKLAVAAVIGFVVAGLAGVVGGLLLLVALAGGLADLLNWPGWAGFLTVSLVLVVAAGAAWTAGSSKWSQVRMVPEQTSQSVMQTLDWLKGLPQRVLGH